MNKANDYLMTGSYIFGLNNELFLHTDQNHIIFLLETNECGKAKSILILNLFVIIFTI